LVAYIEEGTRLRVFENKVMRRIFGLKRDKITREWRKLCNEELNDLYNSPNIIRVINSRRMRLAGYVAHTRERRGAYRVLGGGDLREREHLEDAGIDGRIILKWIFRKWNGRAWTPFIWLRMETGAGSCKRVCELMGSIVCGEFLD